MKAAVFTAPNTIEYFDNYKDPSLIDGFILHIRASGICATDLKAITGTRPGMQPPMILGHEFAGEIFESKLDEFRKGDRVSVAPYAGCGNCFFCLDDREDLCQSKVFLSDGAFAEKVAVPELLAKKTAWKIPDEISFEEAAMTEPLACVVLSLSACQWKPGGSILIVGAGFMGLLHVLLAFSWGASKVLVAEPNNERRLLAEKLGAIAIDPTKGENLGKWSTSHTNGIGPDTVITAVGTTDVVESVIDITRPGGYVHIFGGLPKDRDISVKSYTIHYKSVSLVGTSGYRTRDYKLASKLIANRIINLSPLITSRIPLEKASDAFIQARNFEAVKIILTQ